VVKEQDEAEQCTENWMSAERTEKRIKNQLWNCRNKMKNKEWERRKDESRCN
jgi:hypothetical protein